MTRDELLRGIGVDRETAIGLEPEELAYPLLRWLIRSSESQSLYPPNFANRLAQIGDASLAAAVMEAFCWLLNNGCIAIAPTGGIGATPHRITRRGRALAERGASFKLERAGELVRGSLHDSIRDRVWSEFVRGAYDIAILVAFKQVEVRVREAGGFGNSDYGTDLMRRAFDSKNGPLTDKSAEKSEREAVAHLFAGAMGLLKNPRSHREVPIDDAAEAAEVVMFASYLLRIVDRRRVASRAHSTHVT